MNKPKLHNGFELFATIVVNLIATLLKFGDRSHIGAVHLATSLAADLQLIAAAVFWGWAVHVAQHPLAGETMATIVSLSGGALVANFISVSLLIGETLRRAR